jgi:hypothetical protein
LLTLLLCHHALQPRVGGLFYLLLHAAATCFAARLKLGLQQRQQQQQQQGVAASAAATAGLLSTPALGHITRFKGTSSMRFKPASSSSKQIAPAAAATAAAASIGGALNATAPAAVARGLVLQAGFQLQHHQHVAAAAAATAAGTAWNFKGRQPTAAVARGGDGEPAYFNVDELKQDLERALRKVG